MNLRTDFTMILTILLGVVVTLSASAQNDALQLASRAGEEDFKCSTTGAPPLRVVPPITEHPSCHPRSHILSFDQGGVTRYACVYSPQQARGDQADENGSRWPLLIYLHASHTSPDSLHWLGKELVDLADTFPISGHDGVKGFFLLAPGSRIADPWPSNAPGAAEDRYRRFLGRMVSKSVPQPRCSGHRSFRR